MKPDPEKVQDVSKERGVDWDREIQSGNLVQRTPMARQPEKKFHVQGVPITDQDARVENGKPVGERIKSGETMKYVAETRRYPDAPSGKIFGSAPRGGWPRFDKDSNVVKEES